MSVSISGTNQGKEKLIRLTAFMASLISMLIVVAPPGVYLWKTYATAQVTLQYQAEKVHQVLDPSEAVVPLAQQLQNAIDSGRFEIATIQVDSPAGKSLALGAPSSIWNLRQGEVLNTPQGPIAVTYAINPLQDTDILLLLTIVSVWVAVWTYLLIKIIPVRMIKQALEELAISKESTFQAIKDKELADKTVQLRTMFLANMSHELRTPMNGVLGMIDLASDTTNAGEKEDYLLLAKKSATNLLAVLNDILDFSKIDQGKLDINSIDFNLNDLISVLRKSFEISAQQKNLRFSIDADPCDCLHADPNRLRQVLTNLIGNAIKFTEAGSVHCSVKIRRNGDKDALVVSVSDSGIGIAQDRVEKIFDPFSQADNSTTRKFGGTGLGLTISRQLVELMGGTMQVTSVLNQGSTFTFSIPVTIKQSVHAKVAEVGQDAPQARLRFLIAEDHPINQKLITVILEKQQHQVTMVSNGQEAVDTFKDGLFDIILMDLEMPVLSGIEAAIELRKRGCTTPIVALTAHAVEGFQEKAMAAGMNGFVTKPISLKAIHKIIEQIFPAQLSTRS